MALYGRYHAFCGHIVSSTLLVVVALFAIPVAAARGADGLAKNQEEGAYIPADLDDCFAQLRKLLSADEIAKMRNGAEADMIDYHLSLGLWIRNSWVYPDGSRLRKWFNARGIFHPDDMSGIILDSWWRHLNARPIELDAQIKGYQKYWKEQEGIAKREREREKIVAGAVRKALLGLAVVRTTNPPLALPHRSRDGLGVRLLARFRDGVLIANRRGSCDDGINTPYFLDNEYVIHPVVVPEIDEIQSLVVVGRAGYLSGFAKRKAVLVRIDGGDRSVIPLPETGTVPQLGTDGRSLLAVYPTSVSRLDGGAWKEIHRGDFRLPRSGPPPRRIGDKVFFRDEGTNEGNKQLWWLDLAARSPPRSITQDMEAAGLSGPGGLSDIGWPADTFSYCVDSRGNLWAALGIGLGTQWHSLVRRSPTGAYRVAVVYNSVAHADPYTRRADEDDGLTISAIAPGPDDTILAAGERGLYSIDEKSVKQFVRMINTVQDIDNGAHWHWTPSDVLALGKDSYLIGGASGGVYLVEADARGRWTIHCLDEVLGSPVKF